MAAPPHKTLRVLFVDDEKSLQEFMRSELPRLGHEVVVCPDGRTALKTLEKSSFDVAILDLRMPGMTGIELLEQLKQSTPDTEAIVMTGHASMETAIDAMRLGAFDYIRSRANWPRSKRSCARWRRSDPSSARILRCKHEFAPPKVQRSWWAIRRPWPGYIA